MSVMNKALSQLADKQQSSLDPIEKAHVEPIKTRPIWVWMMAGFGLSLAVGGWAVSQQALDVQNTQVLNQPIQVKAFVEPAPVVASPTQKVNQASVVVYHSAPIEEPILESRQVTEEATEATNIAQPVEPAISTPKTIASNEAARNQTRIQKPVLLASNTTSAPVNSSSVTQVPVMVSSESKSAQENTVTIEQVEMSPEKLAEKAISRANKAMDSSDFQNAVSAYSEALRYTPDNESVRQKLAALYYGKGEVRKAFDLMQRGIEINPEGETLRIALSKLLMKEQQAEAALTPLAYLPASVSVEYLSLRAALAQKVKQNEIALESYQKLTEKEANNGRWWLGLAIQQERSFLLEEAKTSYQKALTKVGVSIQSQAFIRNRLDVLNHLEENNNAN
ncbi:MSHA biogenesis protein MshN [Vibrio diazotrophicus]|uniref:MSHA biogenesis protein MshN n=1 Tax=Vibrio diazotrophicus TaxID=685 RepID=A0A2J8HX64_VIBDI|nr:MULTISPECIES: tetratricopeptide repeat protein [Vibrio]MCF7364325.1 tetratricopeptide repeat protein [Vibrio sp. A1-b2]PNI02845.1 MSHA biogenesis protein MshN [Vibrio diazotrophicus]